MVTRSKAKTEVISLMKENEANMHLTFNSLSVTLIKNK